MYVYLVLSVLFIASTSVIGGFYNRKNGQLKVSSSLYNLTQMLFALLIWTIIYALDFSFDAQVLLYSLGFGVGYTLCMIGMINALRTGSVALTSLFLQLSLIGVTIWGFIFWGEKVTPIAIIGLILVVVALCLCLYNGKGRGEKISAKWLLYVVMMFVGNAMGSIVQRTQQTKFNGQHGNMLMVFAMLIVVIFCLIIYLIGDKLGTVNTLKRSWWMPASAGVCNVALNLFVMILAASTLPAALIYPVISVGGLLVSMIFSIVAFKEKLIWQQWIGVAVGIIAVGVLSL